MMFPCRNILARDLRRHPCRWRRGVTLMELMISMAIVAIVAVAVLPTLAPEEPMKLVGAATLIASDIEYAQSASLADPGDPIVVVFDKDSSQYWLARTSDTETPITRPSSEEPYLIVFGEGDTRQLASVAISVEGNDGWMIPFDQFGRLDQLDNISVRVSNDAGSMLVSVAATTGSVSILDGGQSEEEAKVEEDGEVLVK